MICFKITKLSIVLHKNMASQEIQKVYLTMNNNATYFKISNAIKIYMCRYIVINKTYNFANASW